MTEKHQYKASLVTKFKEEFGAHIKREDWPQAWDNWMNHLWRTHKITPAQKQWVNPFAKKSKNEEKEEATV